MDAARREKKEHGTLSFPFQIYPALDGRRMTAISSRITGIPSWRSSRWTAAASR